jgi:hypothetical protein
VLAEYRKEAAICIQAECCYSKHSFEAQLLFKE